MPTSARWAAANLPKISEKTVHPAGAMWASPPTTGACKFALHIHKNILPSHCFGTRAYLLRGATQIRKWLNASLLRKDTGCAGPAISAQCALYACSADVLPDAAAKAFQQNGLLSGQAGNRYCFHVVAKDRIIELNAYLQRRRRGAWYPRRQACPSRSSCPRVRAGISRSMRASRITRSILSSCSPTPTTPIPGRISASCARSACATRPTSRAQQIWPRQKC